MLRYLQSLRIVVRPIDGANFHIPNKRARSNRARDHEPLPADHRERERGQAGFCGRQHLVLRPTWMHCLPMGPKMQVYCQ